MAVHQVSEGELSQNLRPLLSGAVRKGCRGRVFVRLLSGDGPLGLSVKKRNGPSSLNSFCLSRDQFGPVSYMSATVVNFYREDVCQRQCCFSIFIIIFALALTYNHCSYYNEVMTY